MRVLEGLEPASVMHYFEDVCAIARPSGQEELISNYLVEFAKSKGFEYYQDELKNVIIYKDATDDQKDKETIILQAHIDMVAVADEGYDFSEGVKPYVEDGYIKAKGTTLGADDGIGMAYMLAILASDDLSHPKLECVFTTSEEIGLDGAAGLDLSKISGKKLINLDSEEENNVVVGCAGGCRADISFKYKAEKSKGYLVELVIDGLVGGHSGVEIHKGRANANVLLGRTLYELSKEMDFGLISAWGGTKENAITTKAIAKILIKKKNLGVLENFIEKISEVYKKEHYFTDEELIVLINTSEKVKEKVLSKDDFKRLMVLMNNSPYGPIKMRQENLSYVETSMNLGVLRVGDGKVNVCQSVRSNIEAGREWQKSRLELLADFVGASIEFAGEYPAWEAVGVNDLAKTATIVYEKLFGTKLNVHTEHAGLECALFCSKDEDMRAISIGPNLQGVHTTAEKAEIASIQKEWKFLIELLKA